MISYALEAARASGLFDVIHVSTDSERIAAVADDLGFPVAFLRDPSMAGDHTPQMPVLRRVLERFRDSGREARDVRLMMPCAPLGEAGDLPGASDAYARAGGETPRLAGGAFPYSAGR